MALHIVMHPWRETPKGELTLALEAAKPSLHLVRLGDGSETAQGAEVHAAEIVGDFNLLRSPDERIPDAATSVATILVEVWPDWLEARLLELINGIGGFGRIQSAGKFRRQMRTMDRDAPEDLGHPLAPLGIWGPYVEQVTREVRRGRFKTWEEAASRLDPALVNEMNEAVPKVLLGDLLGMTKPRMLLREPL